MEKKRVLQRFQKEDSIPTWVEIPFNYVRIGDRLRFFDLPGGVVKTGNQSEFIATTLPKINSNGALCINVI